MPLPSRRAVLIGGAATALAAAAGYAWTRRDGACARTLTRPHVDDALVLAAAFMLANQRAAGNFEYQYDWIEKRSTGGDSSVRQAGALWGLTLLHRDAPDPALAAGIARGLAFFEGHSRETKDGERYVVYPGEAKGSLGTVALAALGLIEWLAAVPDAAERYRAQLDGYVRFVLGAVRDDGLFHARYDADGRHSGAPSPYYDGESLLALAKAARYAGYPELLPRVQALADAGFEANVTRARAADPDSDTTKGYYQWASMACFELDEAGERHGDRLLDLAAWMIDTHDVLGRSRNTGYAFEGIVPAYAVAGKRGDTRHARMCLCAADAGLSKLLSWQVGSPRANAFITERYTGDPRAAGGFQNHARESPLRIDVTQHLAHALILARRHLPLG